MDGDGNVFAVLVQATVIQVFQQAELIAGSQVQLKGLGQVGNLALFFRQGDGQAQEVARKLVAHEVDAAADSLQVLDAHLGCQKQVVELDNGVVKLPR